MSDTKPDINENSGRIVRESTKSLDQLLPVDLEKAWTVWSKGVKKVDERRMNLLRAAFEVAWKAGFRAGTKQGAAVTGRKGGKKGGAARAKNLTPEQRSEIAKKAAAARWGKDS